ncbi:MAG: RlpA-like double-psi beta-barrel domain-containing protein [Solirubrobacteraceae bacterium]
MQLRLRSRPLRAAIGALALITIILPAVALAAGRAQPASVAVSVKLSDTRLSYEQRLTATGRIARTQGGRRLALDLAPSGSGWRTLATARVHSDGSYRLRAIADASGKVRVRLVVSVARSTDPSGGAGPHGSSHARSITVGSRLSAPRRGIAVLSGGRARLAGVLFPRRSGRVVQVEVARHGRWSPLARSRTSSSGHFGATVRAHGLGTSALRVRFAGDRLNTGSAAGAGTLQVFRVTQASWYQLTGNQLGCGGRMYDGQLGVANKTLPCGTQVTLRYGGRSIRVPVIDRGPYVGGRTWDLSGETRRRLHFPGTGSVWSDK